MNKSNNNMLLLLVFFGLTLVAGSIFAYGYMNYKYKVDALKIEQESKKVQHANSEALRKQKEANLEICEQEVNDNYLEVWDEQCEEIGINHKLPGCNLPDETAKYLGENRENEISNCIKIFASK